MTDQDGYPTNDELARLRDNFLAYHKCFDSYRRGGHYQLMLPARKK